MTPLGYGESKVVHTATVQKYTGPKIPPPPLTGHLAALSYHIGILLDRSYILQSWACDNCLMLRDNATTRQRDNATTYLGFCNTLKYE